MLANSSAGTLHTLTPLSRAAKAPPVDRGVARQNWHRTLADRLAFALAPRFFSGPLLFDHGLRRSQACDRHSERRGANIVHPHTVAEFHAVGIAAVFSANADLELRPGGTPLGDRPLDQQSDTIDIE